MQNLSLHWLQASVCVSFLYNRIIPLSMRKESEKSPQQVTLLMLLILAALGGVVAVVYIYFLTGRYENIQALIIESPSRS